MRWLDAALGALTIVVTAAVLGVTVNGFARAPLPLDRPYESVLAPHAIDLAKARDLFGAHQFLFVDVRTAREFGRGHIPGALSRPSQGPESPLPQAPGVVLYCDGPRCGTAEDVAARLTSAVNVTMLTDGFTGWQTAGFPVQIP